MNFKLKLLLCIFICICLLIYSLYFRSTTNYEQFQDSQQLIQNLANTTFNLYDNVYAYSALNNNGAVVSWGNNMFGGEISTDKQLQLNSGVVNIF